jgi:hypothetical protein
MPNRHRNEEFIMFETKTVTKKVRYTTADPPSIPEHWQIWNAPRPIYGTILWEGDYLDGIFYAAINPEAEWAEWQTTENVRLDASPVLYRSQAQALAWFKSKAIGDSKEARAYADALTFYNERHIWRAYVEENEKTLEFTIPL